MKNKKILIALLLVGILSAIGTTFAYFSSSNTFENVFNTDTYSTEVTEVFDSPENWTPGTTTEKVVYATNTGTVPATVRVSYEESWVDAEGNPLPLTDSSTPPNRYAIINHPNNFDGKWIESEEGGTTYYYYKYALGPEESTTHFMDSVTYNADAVTQSTDGCTENETTHIKICSSTLNEYGGGTYTLTVKVETVQYDQYKNAWNTEVNILSGLPYTIVSDDLDTVGSVVKIANEEFYVIGQEDSTHVKLLSKWNLKVGNIFDSSFNKIREYSSSDVGYGLQSSDVKGYVSGDNRYYGGSSFSNTNYWYENDRVKSEYGGSFPSYVYDSNSIIKAYVDNYVTYLNTQGVSVTGRIIRQEELVGLGCDASNETCLSAPEWVYQTSYWTGTAQEKWNLWHVLSSGALGHNNTYILTSSFGVRPVIILEK